MTTLHKCLADLTLMFVATSLALAGGPKFMLTDAKVAPSDDQVTFEKFADNQSLTINFAPGEAGYPGVKLTTENGAWDLSEYGHIEATVTNKGTKNMLVALRADNEGDWKKEPYNTAQTYIKPGQTGTIKLIFGYSYNKPAYKLDSSKVIAILIFTGKVKDQTRIVVESLTAGGQPGETMPVDPKSLRIKPENGKLLGEGVKFNAEKQLTAKDASVSAAEGALEITFPAEKEGSVSIKPAEGRWDLRQALQVSVKVKNSGEMPVSPRFRIDSNAGKSSWVEPADPIAAGAVREISIPFKAATIWNGEKGSGDQLTNDAVAAVVIQRDKAAGEGKLVVESIVAGVPLAPPRPEWLGKRPPVEGDWTQTFSDDFDGPGIDASKWNIYGENYWDKQSHFSKDNVIVADGMARLRFERKHGFQNDDPNHKRQTDYATGFLQTYGKFTQKYGYFESRMKLPTAPGLWPAFWMMPDRGVAGDPQWKRQDTKFGGMEFDIMEYLTRWGPYRYNIAIHWDGYQKDHKSTGSDKIYFQPDADGYLTAGLLWTPGELVWYCNGNEVARWKNDRVSTVAAEMMFTLPMGGWDNSPLDDAKLPDDFVIDYVRAWQRNDLAETGGGATPAAR